MGFDVFILAAGFGTRLKPLTDTVPKPLIEIGEKTLLAWNLDKIAELGVRRVIINTHYLSEQIASYLAKHNPWNFEFVISHEPVILDTGGGIKNIETHLKHKTLLVINSDVLIDRAFNYRSVIDLHCSNQSKPLITAVVRSDKDSKKYGELLVARDGQLCGFLGKKYLDCAHSIEVMYTGIQVLDARVFEKMPEVGEIFGITRDTWPRLLEEKLPIHTYKFDGFWTDVGTLERLEEARQEVAKWKNNE